MRDSRLAEGGSGSCAGGIRLAIRSAVGDLGTEPVNSPLLAERLTLCERRPERGLGVGQSGTVRYPP